MEKSGPRDKGFTTLVDDKSFETATTNKTDRHGNAPESTGSTDAGSSLTRRTAANTGHAERRRVKVTHESLPSLMKSIGVPEDALPNLQKDKAWKELEKHGDFSLRHTRRGPRLELKGKEDVPDALVGLLFRHGQYGLACEALAMCAPSKRLEALKRTLGFVHGVEALGRDTRRFLSKEEQRTLNYCLCGTAKFLARQGDVHELKGLIRLCDNAEQRVVVAHLLREPLLYLGAAELLDELTPSDAQRAMKLAVKAAKDSAHPRAELMCLARLIPEFNQSGALKKKGNSDTRSPAVHPGGRLLARERGKLSSSDLQDIYDVMESTKLWEPELEPVLTLPSAVMKAMNDPDPSAALLKLAQGCSRLEPKLRIEREAGIRQAIFRLYHSNAASPGHYKAILQVLQHRAEFRLAARSRGPAGARG